MHAAFAEVQTAHQQQLQVQQGIIPPAEVARPPAWLDCASRPKPRPSPEQRQATAAARHAASQQQEVQPSAPSQLAVLRRLRTLSRGDDQQDVALRFAQPVRAACPAWHALTDPTMSREHVVVAWRILHGALAVGGKRAWQDRRLQPQSVCCQVPACSAANALETLTHAFVTCPVVQPVVTWLFQVYQALTHTAPPAPLDLPLVLLADMPGLWEPGCTVTWQRLRVAYLGCAWQIRCSKVASRMDASAVAAMLAQRVVTTLKNAVIRDWQRIPAQGTSVLSRARALHLPTTWFAGRSPDLKLEQFNSLWPPTLRSWFHMQPAGGIQVKLSLQWPVSFQQGAQQVPAAAVPMPQQPPPPQVPMQLPPPAAAPQPPLQRVQQVLSPPALGDMH
jgi:hypothetical protein